MDYASLLWDEFASYIKHLKKTIEISSAWFWSLILHEVYSQVGILIFEDAEVAQFYQMFIPKSTIDDPIVFPVVGRIPDVMLNLVSVMNSLLVQYKASIDTTSSGSIPKKVTFK